MERRSFLKLGAGALAAESFVRSAEATMLGWRGLWAVPANVASVRYFGVFREATPVSTKPHGWMREMLTRQVNGLAKHHAVSGFPYDTCLWAGDMPAPKHGERWWPYEQAGYLIDGLERLGLAMDEPAVLEEARANLRYVLDHQAADGSLGPTDIGMTNWPTRSSSAPCRQTATPLDRRRLQRRWPGTTRRSRRTMDEGIATAPTWRPWCGCMARAAIPRCWRRRSRRIVHSTRRTQRRTWRT